jgi:hypothetical protein
MAGRPASVLLSGRAILFLSVETSCGRPRLDKVHGFACLTYHVSCTAMQLFAMMDKAIRGVFNV